jgi:hypothetical protein
MVDASLAISGARASYTIAYNCAPRNVGKVPAIIICDLGHMRTENISASELHQAEALFLGQVLLEGRATTRSLPGF